MGSSSQGIGGKLTGSGVGLTGPQSALNQYTLGEDLLNSAQAFQQGPSTMQTQMYAGNLAKEGQQAGLQSLQNTQAVNNFLNQQFSGLAGGLGSILSSIGNLGSGGGGGGTGGIASLPGESSSGVG